MTKDPRVHAKSVIDRYHGHFEKGLETWKRQAAQSKDFMTKTVEGKHKDLKDAVGELAALFICWGDDAVELLGYGARTEKKPHAG